jgi:hypothetical protein
MRREAGKKKRGEMPEQEQQAPPHTEQQTTPIETFEDWLAAQDEKVKTLYATHTSGLQSALKSERDARSQLEKQMRDLAKKADKGSELEAALTKQADQLSALEKQAAFQDKAHAAGVRNLKLAFLAAAQAGLVNDRGDCDFAKLKTEYPELFLSAPAPANAGNGTGTKPTTGVTMNDFILRAAGRK